MAITLDPKLREQGVVYLDPALADGGATHVLIIGVGVFDRDLPAVSSPTISARAMASYFLDGATGAAPGFANAACPLGSLAMLLSETADGAVAQVAGGPVPRARHGAIAQAVQAWVARAMTNPASTAILYFASHGQAFLRSTAIMCEDYGGYAPDRGRFGMVDTERLIVELSTVAPEQKLLIFDCCRLPNDITVTPEQDFGWPLYMAPPLKPGEIGIRPQVLRSTRYGAEAYGRKDKTTLFTQALLDALYGLAADPADDWQIRTAGLADKAERILSLYREGAVKLQVPDYALTSSFQIAEVGPTDQVTAFVALVPPLDPKSAKLRLIHGAEVTDVDATSGPEPFARLRLKEDESYHLIALDAQGQVLGETDLDVPAPIVFRSLPRAGKAQVIRSKGVDLAPAPPQITVNTPDWQDLGAGAAGSSVVRIQSLKPHAVPVGPQRRVQDSGSHGEFAAAPGRFRVTVARPEGPSVVEDVLLGEGEEFRLDLAPLDTPHEWLGPAVASGVLRREEIFAAPLSPDALPPPTVTLVGPTPSTAAELIPSQRDRRFHLFAAQNGLADRFPPAYGADLTAVAMPVDLPVWAEFSGIRAKPAGQGAATSWRERCFVPLAGAAAPFATDQDQRRDGWQADVLVDMEPAHQGSHCAAVVQSRVWGGMLAFLAQRDFLNGGAVAEGIVAHPVLRDAIAEKTLNPIAAIAAGLLLVGTGKAQVVGDPAYWLNNLATWFPGLPDGAVLLGRWLQTRRDPRAAEAYAAAFRRGVPVFSLAVDWLAEGLRSYGSADAAVARAWSRSVDPDRAFTVLQMTEATPWPNSL